MPKMMTIDSVESAPHIREIYSYRRSLPYFHFYSFGTLHSLQPEQQHPPEPQCLNQRRFSQGTVPFRGVESREENFKGHIFLKN
jgi:hypothetical protein